MKLVSRQFRLLLRLACVLGLFAGGIWITQAWAQEGRAYLSDIPDLPLMEGLEELAGQGLAFDKPSGRIVEARAREEAGSGLDEQEVRRFYAQTLGQLGWEAMDRDVFLREGERLSITYERTEGRLLVGFTLQPE